MGQLTIYLPDEVEKALRREARRARKSMSALVVERISAPSQATEYLSALERLHGSWKGDFPEPRELKLRDVSPLE